MGGGGTYLDLDILINGGMDALLLVLTAKFLQLPLRPKRILLGVLLGEVPVLMAYFAVSPWTAVSKWVVPFLMVGVSFPAEKPKVFFKALLGFWLLSTGLGGFVYALWGWAQFGVIGGGGLFSLALNNLWILPLGALSWWFLQGLWQRWQERKLALEQVIYDLEICFDEEGSAPVRVKALLDTGNQLRDPLTGSPVILLEEEAAAASLPDELRSFLDLPWKDYADPWPLLWQVNPKLVKYLVFIPFQGIERQSWLLGIRPQRVAFLDGKGSRPVKATVALVKQILSPEGEYQSLIHPEHVQKGGDG